MAVVVFLVIVGWGLLQAWRWSRWACMIYFAVLALKVVFYNYGRFFVRGTALADESFFHYAGSIFAISLILWPVIYLAVGKKPRAYFRATSF